ncbi:hypothetical protein A1O7_03352 [Cladophialophora yegresii CBS 114405]|uniref:F-box domain-containing protein n=1 Tax=Cladophialophora yegresii CBS 114405 TaxID=1182544 RepID=W9WXC6_9EURO|nr:uncharacterized protein A1O7_03352 [Cladophialophora yegresii CBS 114405]EXJ62909.1 hypothetical protein A1O7_03352 [Cladophialophora yegresii CBS 114405]
MLPESERQGRLGNQHEHAADPKVVESHSHKSLEGQARRASTRPVAEALPDGLHEQVIDGSNELPIHYVSNSARRRHKVFVEDEPLIDTTAALAKHSKKTARLQKRQQKKQARRVHSEIQSFLDFPQELLLMILGFLEPSEILTMLRLNRSIRALITDNERAIADDVMRHRYWVLKQCFPLPVPLEMVPLVARPALMSEQWQDRLRIHKNPYQHIKHIDPSHTCTCMSCVLAWNNLNIILDLAHWQQNLATRVPLPIIPRGTNPEWNVNLLERHAGIVTKAMKSPLIYARILQIHLDTTTRTIIRSGNWRKKGEKSGAVKPRTYHLTDAEAAAGTDEFLERSGPPSYQPIYMRDNYYSVEAFVPNRKWGKEEQKWFYYAKWPRPHENDLNWLAARFTPKTEPKAHEPPSGNGTEQSDGGFSLPNGTTPRQPARLMEVTFSWDAKPESGS